MPTYPEQNSKSISTAISYNPNIPVMHRINGFSLEQNGWTSIGQNAYAKDGEVVKYDGVYWTSNGERVNFIEEIKPKK